MKLTFGNRRSSTKIRPRDLEVYRAFVMALPANAEESGLTEGMHLESKNDNAAESKRTWQAMLKGSTNKYVGYVKSVEEAMAVLREYELETTSKFSCFKSDKMFGAGDPFARRRKVYFKDNKIPFDGVPFSIIATNVFDCQHGPDRKKPFKAKHAENKIDDHSFRRKRFLPQDTMKFRCPASIWLSEGVKYYNYKIRENTERLRRDMSKKLKTDITDGQKPEFERRIYIQLPKGDEHRDHIIGEVGGILQPIDKRLVHKIGELVGEGVKTVDEMKRHLRKFVKTELFPEQTPWPSSTNRRYYPTDADVRNHMCQASVKKLLSKTDQENHEKKIKINCI